MIDERPPEKPVGPIGIIVRMFRIDPFGCLAWPLALLMLSMLAGTVLAGVLRLLRES